MSGKKSVSMRTLKFFQKISRAFLVPMAIIAASALMVGISSVLKNPTIVSWLPFLENTAFQYVVDLAGNVGSITMNYLPVIYAITLAFSLANEEKEFAAFAGFMGYLAFLTSMGIVIKTFPSVKEVSGKRASGSTGGGNSQRGNPGRNSGRNPDFCRT